MDAMRIFHWLFAFACEEREDGAAKLWGLLASNSCVDRIFAEAAEGVVLEIGRGCFVLRVLKATDNACSCLALRSGTGEDMAWATFIILKGNIGFEE
jgi:hypothetical protein